MRWIASIVFAAAAGSIAYGLGAGPEVAYVVRSIVRHLAVGVLIFVWVFVAIGMAVRALG